MRHAMIMAGGSGSRLWPLSRSARPKQLLRLFGGQSLLRQAFERLARVLPPERIGVITLERHLPLIHAELPELPAENLIGEPEGRDTANAVALSAALLHRRDPDAVMGVFTADHVITPAERFSAALEAGYAAAEAHPSALVTFGVTVQRPETAFGYVQRGARIGPGVYRVEHFAEKPDAATARGYAESGRHYWNSGMFVWRAATILDELDRHLPAAARAAAQIAAAWNTPGRTAVLADLYPRLPKISIDFAVMEKAAEVLVVEMDCRWADVGSWSQLGTVLDPDADGNLLVAAQALVRAGKGVALVSEDPEHLLVAVGVEDVIVVHSPDATLVCGRSAAAQVKDVVVEVQHRYGGRWL